MVRDSFLKRLYMEIKRYPCLLGDVIAIAVSGGVDSMVLLESLFMLREAPLLKDKKFFVVTIDHGIRDDSAEEVKFVEKLARRRNMIPLVYKLSPESFSEHYLHVKRKEIWNDVIHNYGIDKIWLAHHKDDVIEHVLLQLLRGEEIRGLTSLKRCAGYIARPLLSFSKDDIKSFASRHKIKYFEDITNNDISIPRNFIRHKIVPQLRQKFDIYNIWRSYNALTLQREALDIQIENFVRNHAKISENTVVINGSWPVVVEASIFILKGWGITPSGRLVERLNELWMKHAGSKVVWKDISIIKTDKGVKIIRGD
ncbi:MAG: tRNA lysidine(34) synthetase TilS [Dictyoglomi bacterium]|nr:tRNA lysidine(34) synthetase TilS [Dictyoglomota bacterium]